jgi:hypothetical protein
VGQRVVIHQGTLLSRISNLRAPSVLWSSGFLFCAFYVMTTIGFLTTNHASRALVTPIRAVAISAVIVGLAYALLSRQIPRASVISVPLYLFTLLLGLGLALLNGSFDKVSEGFSQHLVVCSIGLMVVSGARAEDWDLSIPRFVVLYSICCASALWAVGAMEADFPPRFLYEYTADKEGAVVNYSQEVSRLFGYAAIAACAILLRRLQSWVSGATLAALVVGFLSLSLIGGGRGDSLGAVMVVILALVWARPLLTALVFITAGVSLALFVGPFDELWRELMIVNRILQTLDGDFGQRDMLLRQSIDLLVAEPRCALLGCGLGFFQHFYSMPWYGYPHNFIAEMCITYGLVFTMVFLVVLGFGFLSFVRSRGFTCFASLLFIYTLIISMKSFDIVTNWFLMVFSFYFIGRWIAGALSRTRPDRVANRFPSSMRPTHSV